MVKKQLIIDKALELFANQGFEATSVQQITELCGISKGAFYLSFKSKDELIMAIIDHCMIQIISDIDYTVRMAKKEEMLYEFYHTMIRSFGKHYSFAMIFIKERVLPPHEELLQKLHDYDNRFNRSVLYMLERLYDDEVNKVKYDLLVFIKGIVKTYAEMNIHNNANINIDLFVSSLVEKTNIIAQYTTIPYLTKEMFESSNPFCQYDQIEIDEKEQIITLIEQKIPEIEDSIEKESLEMIKHSLISGSSSLALIKGLLENLKTNPECKSISYLVREYYRL